MGGLHLLKRAVLCTCLGLLIVHNTPVLAESQFLCESVNTSPQHGVVLITHGLNHEITTMAPLGSTLKQDGLSICFLRLAGHGDNYSTEVAEDTWRKQFENAFNTLKTDFPNQPHFALAYSLGSAVTLDFLDSHPGRRFDKIVLLAPAVSLRFKAKLLQLLTPLRIFGFSLPSFSLEQYRVQPNTSLLLYHRAFQTIDRIKHLSHPSDLNKIPCLMFLSEKDELLSFDATKDWLKENNLSSWALQKLRPKAQIAKSYQHLIIDEQTLGKKEWIRLHNEIRAFFRSEPTDLPTPPHL